MSVNSFHPGWRGSVHFRHGDVLISGEENRAVVVQEISFLPY